MAHTRAWDETKPAGTDNISAGDDEIRNSKRDIRERLAVDHEYNDDTTVDGRHKKITAKQQSADPTAITGYGFFYTKLVSSITEAFYMDNAGTVTQLTSNGVLKNVMLLTTDQTAAGVKTFSSIPMLPNTNPTHVDEATRKEYVDGKISKTTAGEISIIPEKLSLVAADVLLVEDSAAAWAKKRTPASEFLKINDTNYVDLTDGGSTTLHTHGTSGGRYFRLNVAMTEGVAVNLDTSQDWTNRYVAITAYKDTYLAAAEDIAEGTLVLKAFKVTAVNKIIGASEDGNINIVAAASGGALQAVLTDSVSFNAANLTIYWMDFGTVEAS